MKKENRSTKADEILQKKTFYGKEKKGIAYIIGTMNMILHGIESPNIEHINTLSENIRDIQEKDRLINATNDADDFGHKLLNLGFIVNKVQDCNNEEFFDFISLYYFLYLNY